MTRELTRWIGAPGATVRERWRDARWREGLVVGALAGAFMTWLFGVLDLVLFICWTAIVAVASYRVGRRRRVVRGRVVGIDRRFTGETFVLFDDGHEERVA